MVTKKLEPPDHKTILVVDDDQSICTFFETLLGAEGFNVVTETNGKEAIRLLQRDSYMHFDLLILDLMMPHYGGFEVLRELQQEGYQSVPIFVITARALDQGTVDMIRMESNVQDFLKKPVDPKDVRKKVHYILKTVPRKPGLL